MYFPYLYARQSEFLALRAMLSDHRPAQLLLPVLEPVNRNAKPLLDCLKGFNSKARAITVVVNPDKHQLKNTADLAAWQTIVLPELAKLSHVLPAYKCMPTTTMAQITAFISSFPGRQVVLVYANPTLSNADITTLASNPQVSFHIVLNAKMVAAQQMLLPAAKLVDIQDDFNKQARNANYSGKEYFTDRHITLRATHTGFGDFTCIGNEFTPGGGQPGAVAIHTIFKHPQLTNQIWIEHFVSTSSGAVAQMFQQAAVLLTTTVNSRPREFGRNFALDEYRVLTSPPSHFPGLRVNKTLQIAHHICLVLDVLTGTV